MGDRLDRPGGSLIGNSRAARMSNVLADRQTSSLTTDTGRAISSPGSGFEPQAEAFTGMPLEGIGGNARFELATIRLQV